tara:strand:+ start:647 stop:1114 length:468 start_codon:yes stop_codon:yes gene_type:complete
MNAFDDVIGNKLFGKLCYGPPHRLSGPDHALRCHFYRRRIASVVVGIVIGLMAAIFLYTSRQGSSLSNSWDSDKGDGIGVAVGAFLVVAPSVALATYFIYGIVVTSGYHYYNDMFLEKKDMYMRAGDSEQRAEILADNDVSNEFDRRKVAARYAN